MSRYNESMNSLFGLIGNTPLIKLSKSVESLNGSYYAKWEGANPGHSIKDRIALYIIEKAEKKGLLKPGATIVETTSGNTGFSLAMIAIKKGYRCVLAVNSKASEDKINMLRSMNALVWVCPAKVSANDPNSYYNVAKHLAKKYKNAIYVNQYFNDLNVEAHYHTTGPEIWNQTSGKITHLIASSGTGGTISGVGKYLKEKNPNIKVIGVDAYGSVLKKYHETGEIDPNEIHYYRIEGMGKNLIPSATKFQYIDRYVKVDDENSAYKSRLISRSEGIFVGYTSGGVLQATYQLNSDNEFNKDSRVVLIFPDHGSRYINRIYSDKWMKKQGFLKQENKKSNR